MTLYHYAYLILFAASLFVAFRAIRRGNTEQALTALIVILLAFIGLMNARTWNA